MPNRENAIKGLAEISEYARAKADIAGIGKGKEVFDSWYRAAEDARELLREQKPVATDTKRWSLENWCITRSSTGSDALGFVA